MERRVHTYDREHKKRREEMLPRAYNTPCPRCGDLMLRGQDLDLGHSEDVVTNPNAKADRIEHATCNRGAGANIGNRRQRFRPSREW